MAVTPMCTTGLRDYTTEEIDDVLLALSIFINEKKTTDKDKTKAFVRVNYWLDRRLELTLKGGENGRA